MDVRNKRLWVAGGALVIVTAAAGGVYLTRDDTETRPDPNRTMKVTSDVEGYIGYEVGDIWFPDTVGGNAKKYGDLDGDGDVTDEETETVKESEEFTEKFKESTPGAGKRTAASLVTPPGHDWWLFVTSQLDHLSVWDWPAPTDAHWYANTWVKSRDGESYPALHIAFTSEEAMYGWAAERDYSSGVIPHYRGNVLTITPAGIDAIIDGFGTNVDESTTTTPTVATWTINFGKQFTYDAANSPWSENYELFWRLLGFNEKTTWTATSQTPTRWAGKITGRGEADVQLAALALTNTQTEASPGLSGMLLDTYLEDDDATIGNGDLRAKSAPADVDLAFSTTEAFRGVAVRGAGRIGSVSGVTARWIVEDTMVIEQWTGTAPEAD